MKYKLTVKIRVSSEAVNLNSLQTFGFLSSGDPNATTTTSFLTTDLLLSALIAEKRAGASDSHKSQTVFFNFYCRMTGTKISILVFIKSIELQFNAPSQQKSDFGD